MCELVSLIGSNTTPGQHSHPTPTWGKVGGGRGNYILYCHQTECVVNTGVDGAILIFSLIVRHIATRQRICVCVCVRVRARMCVHVCVA